MVSKLISELQKLSEEEINELRRQFSETPDFSLTPRTTYEWNGEKHRLLDVFSDHLEETLQYINDEKIDMISVSPYYGYKSKNIDFILDIKGLKGIIVFMMENCDLSAISKCTSLEYVFVGDVSQKLKLDLSTLPNLCELRLDLFPGIQMPSSESGKNLRLLGFSRYRGKTFDSITGLFYFIVLLPKSL